MPPVQRPRGWRRAQLERSRARPPRSRPRARGRAGARADRVHPDRHDWAV